jgi:hypothetical protein
VGRTHHYRDEHNAKVESTLMLDFGSFQLA